MNKKTISVLWGYLRKHAPLICVSLLLASISVIVSLYIPIMIGKIVDVLTSGSVDLVFISGVLVRIALCVAASALAQYLMGIINDRIVYRTIAHIRDDLFIHIQSLPIKYLDGRSHGEIVNIAINDLDQAADGLLLGTSQFFTSIMTIFGTLGFMFHIDPGIALLVLVLTPLALLVSRFIAKRTYVLFRRQSEQRGRQTSLIEEYISNQKIVQAYGQQGNIQELFDEANEELTRTSLAATFYSSLTNPSTRLVNASIYAILALCGALSVIKGNISVGALSSCLSYANQYTKPFNEISSVVTELQNSFACCQRVFALLEEDSEVEDGDEELDNVYGDVVFDDVSFSYVKDREFISGLDVHLAQGQRVALVGPTGCGKTTIINLLMRFYETDGGKIVIDGKDITEVSRRSLRRNIGMILQDTWLKEGTIKENIAIGRTDASDEQIVKAAKMAHADSFIRRMAKGYDTRISENGEPLSQGQKQLLCISRLMLSLPPILILDEATSSIDTRTEMAIQDSFAKLMEGKTSFIVAHRLSTIKEADLILVMKDGKIIEKGDHDELIKKDGFYKQLYYSQFEPE